MKRPVTRIALRSLALSMALAGLGTSWAQDRSCELRSLSDKAAWLAAGLDQPLTFDPCLRTPHEGLAALLLPRADHADGEALRWGFLAADGTLAIEPRFEEVSDFHHGLAAAQENGKWGYIDRRGQWVIAPRFDAASDFVQIGLATVSQDGQQMLIGRDGRVVGKLFGTEVENLVLGEGVPARVKIIERPYYRSLQGERREAPRDFSIDSSFGDRGLAVAINKEDGKYGIVDAEWQWRVKPVYERLSMLNVGEGLPVGIGEREVDIITFDGRVIGSHYQSITPLGQAFMLAERDYDQPVDLLDASGATVTQLSRREVSEFDLAGDIVLRRTGRRLIAYIPGVAKPIPLDAAVAHTEQVDRFVLLRNVRRQVVGLITPTGRILSNKAITSWARGAAQYESKNGLLWVRSAQPNLLNVIDSEGRALLTEKARLTLEHYDLEVLPEAATAPTELRPLALLTQHACGDHHGTGNGLLLSNGTVLMDAHWLEIAVAEASEGVLPKKPADWRFRVRTDAGWGLIDGTGRWVLPAEYENIGGFSHDHVLAYRKGVLSVFSRDGHQYPLPDVFEAEQISPTMVRYRETAADDAQWGLYDFTKQTTILAPALHDIEPFVNGYAAAALNARQWGVLDAQGKWTIAPRYPRIEQINDTLWRVDENASDETRAAIMHVNGREVIGFHAGLNASSKGDAVSVKSKGQHEWLLKPDGTLIAGERSGTFDRVGSWLLMQNTPQEGYLDASGNWRIAPNEVSTGSPFNMTSGRAVRNLAESSVVIGADGKTITALPKGNWSWPFTSDWLIEYGNDKRGYPQTRFANADGQIALTVNGTAGEFSDGRAVMVKADGRMKWIDRKGNAISDIDFTDLGQLHEGLAYASNQGKYGFIDTSGHYVIPPVYETVTTFDAGVAAARSGDDSLLLDRSGKLLARIVTRCGLRILYGPDHRRLWPASISANCSEK